MRVLAIIGPSGVGKSALVHELSKRGLIIITPSTTDRPRRRGEALLEHVFVSTKEFDRLQQDGKLLDEVQPFGLAYRYGLPVIKTEKNKVPLVMMRALVIDQLRVFYPDLVIYQIEADYDFARSQLEKRSDKDHGNRLTEFHKEIALGKTIASEVFVNDSGDITDLANKVATSLESDFSNILNLKADKRVDPTDKK